MENKLIRFYETKLVTFIDLQGKPFVAVKHICDAIGLNANSALRAIRNHPILGPASSVQYHQVGENQRREYLMVPIEYLNGWLFSIDINKVKPEAQKKLMVYQKECYQVLYNAWFGVNRNIVDKQKQCFLLLQYLRNAETHISLLSHRKKEIYKQLDGIDSEIFVQLKLFPQNAIG
ncbi:MAG TPA: hypothetical protein DCR40_16775 [Prolixibacteraceae bacterium]|nr:hypothetical protein [Prolixibacteraceae bacterium]